MCHAPTPPLPSTVLSRAVHLWRCRWYTVLLRHADATAGRSEYCKELRKYPYWRVPACSPRSRVRAARPARVLRRTRQRTARRCCVGCTVLDGSLAYYLMGYLQVLGSTRGHSMMALPAECWVGTRWVSRVAARVLACAAAAARRRAARAVLSCAGAYVSGAAGSNACPAGSVWIATEAACRTAATAAGKTVPSAFVETDPYVPRGCYYVSMSTSVYNNYAYFNPHPVGASDSTYRLLCAVTSGARARTPARAAALSMRTCAIVRA